MLGSYISEHFATASVWIQTKVYEANRSMRGEPPLNMRFQRIPDDASLISTLITHTNLIPR